MDKNTEKTLETTSANKKLFFCSFTVVMIMKCLNISKVSSYIPYSYIYFLYIAIWGALAIVDTKGKIKLKMSPSRGILFALAGYYLIWGFHNIQGIDFNDAFGNMIRSLLLTCFIAVSCYWVKKWNCLIDFIRNLYYTFSIYIIFWIVVSIPQINILRTFSTFFSFDNNIRYRNYLGFSYPNIGAEMAVCAIVFSKAIAPYDKHRRNIIRLINIFMFFAVLINNSRGSLLALFVFECVSFYLYNKNNLLAVKKTANLILVGTLGVASVILYLIVVKGMTLFEILQGTNRQAALLENIVLLENSGQWLMGVGRLTGGFFSEKNIVYGAQTGYLEVFYFEVFITSGILGSILVAMILLYIARKIVSLSKSNRFYLRKWIFCVFVYMLFVSLFESYMFSYVYASSMCLNVVVLSYLDIYNKNYYIQD